MQADLMDELYEWQELDAQQSALLKGLSPQQLLTMELAGKRICFTKVDDQILGIMDRCPHAGTPLHMGTCNRKGVIVCPTHHYKFDMKTGLSADGNHYKLRTFKVKPQGEVFLVGWRK